MRLLENEIRKIADATNLKKSIAILPFYATIIRYYFLHKLGKSYEDKIDELIGKQFPEFRKYYLRFSKSLLLEIEKLSYNLLANGSIDLIGNIYDRLIETDLKKVLGQFYTPLPLVDHILNSVNLRYNSDCKIADISCGAGIFLSEAVKMIINENEGKNGALLDRIISQVYGYDIDKNAYTLSKLNLLLATFPLWKRKLTRGKRVNLNFNIFCENALTFFPKHPNLLGKFSHVVGNPPFVEAKRLPKEDKEICRNNFKDVAKGAFDIYVCFLKLGIELLRKNGHLGYVLPNKFLVAKYAKNLREQIIKNYCISEICDISNLNYFSGTSVYPILFILQNKAKGHTKIISYLKNESDFEKKKFKHITMKQANYKLFSNLYPIYLFENEEDREIFSHILKRFKTKTGDILNLRTTVSFHIKGLREKYVSKFIESEYKYKYLGGESYARKNEVSDFSIEWKGYYINYDSEELKGIHNPLPPLSNFLRPKIIFCQHAKRMLAYCDIKGEWITKDVFPIAYLKEDNDKINRTLYYTGLFNSSVFSYIYSMLYRGIQIHDGYFHFLPIFLSVIPVPEEKNYIVVKVASIVKSIQNKKISKEEGIRRINDLFYGVYNLKKAHTKRIEEYHRRK